MCFLLFHTFKKTESENGEGLLSPVLLAFGSVRRVGPVLQEREAPSVKNLKTLAINYKAKININESKCFKKWRAAEYSCKFYKRGFTVYWFFKVLNSTMLHLPRLRFHCIRGSCDRTQDAGIEPRMLGSNPRCWDRTPDAGVEPRMLGSNPRMLRSNPRILGSNPDAFGTQGCWDRTQDAGIEPKDAGIEPKMLGSNLRIFGSNPRC
jgi:hypothetical protein